MDVPTPLHLTPCSRRWPRALETIEGPPDELWVRGRAALLDGLEERTRVAIVGSRAPTPYGEAQARRFARDLAAAGAVIVSGLARGIDQAAHAGALEAGGDTLAVLGGGVDAPWPVGPVPGEVARRGLLLSEYPPGRRPRRHHFPLRNRLISGLSQAVLVVEAGFASGSLITARWAADQGREVLAVPGRVDHPMARGCHRLLKEGAALAEDPEDVLAALGHAPARAGGRARAGGPREPEGPLLAALEGETLGADELARRTGLALVDVLVELVREELAGRVARAPGGLYRRT